MDTADIQEKKKKLITDLQLIENARHEVLSDFERATGCSVEVVRITNAYEVGSSRPRSIVEDVVIAL